MDEVVTLSLEHSAAKTQKAFSDDPTKRERATLAVRRWRARSGEKAVIANRIYARTYYLANRESELRRNATYYKMHPERVAIKGAKRATRLAQAVTNLTPQDWIGIQAAYHHKCAYCGKSDKKLTIDHVIPVSLGGGLTKANIVPACKPCNSRKRDGPPPTPVKLVLV